MTGKVSDPLRGDRVQGKARKGRVSLDREQPDSVEIAPSLERVR